MRTKKFDSINVVPFIDIMLVLLVIVLTTASFVAKGIIPIDLAQGKSSTKLKDEKSLVITIDKAGQIFFEKEIINKKDIETALKKYKTSTPVNLNCDKNSKFENFVYIIDILKEKNYKNLSIITKQN